MVSSEYEILKIKYDALAKENEILKQTLKHDVDKIEAGYASERDQLKAEVELLKSRLAHFQNLHKEFHDQLTREREITAMLREALEAIAKSIPESINTSEVEVEQTAAAQRTLAREKDLRSDKSGKA